MDVICINDDSHTFRMCNVSFGGTKMNQDCSDFNWSNKNQLKRAIRNNPKVYNQINASLENTLNSVVHLPTGHTASYGISDLNKGMAHAALLDASVGGTANGLRGAHIANSIKVNRVHPSDEWFRTVLASVNESDATSWFTSLVFEQIGMLRTMNMIPKEGLLIAIDMHKIARYDRTHGLELKPGKSEKGTSTFEQYITAQCVNKGIRLNLAEQRVPALVSGPEAVGDILDSILSTGVKIHAVLLDREFFAVQTIRELNKRDVDYVIPAKNTSAVKDALKEFAENNRDLVSEQMIKSVDGEEYYVLSIKKRRQVKKSTRCAPSSKTKTSKKTKIKKTSNKKSTCSAAPEDEYIGFAISTPKLDPDIYSARWGIETGYAKLESMRAKTRSRNIGARVFCFVYSLLLFNLWVIINAINKYTANQYHNTHMTQLMLKHMLLLLILDNSSSSKSRPRPSQSPPPPPSLYLS